MNAYTQKIYDKEITRLSKVIRKEIDEAILKKVKELASMKTYNIYVEGYVITGNSGYATHLASVTAESFEEACNIAYDQGKFDGYGEFDERDLSLWGCRLYDNLVDAQKAFG